MIGGHTAGITTLKVNNNLFFKVLNNFLNSSPPMKMYYFPEVWTNL